MMAATMKMVTQAKSLNVAVSTRSRHVFWNGHEPEQGKYNFEGEYDLVKFIKLIAEQKMYAIMRLSPLVQAEWNNGGLPYWQREDPNTIFRSDNEPFKRYMKKFVTMIVDKLKAEKLFASQGGPIIVAQIENEYNTIQLAFREKGVSYIQWAAKMALDLNIGVPWIMCKQKDAPDPVINSCNGRQCGDTFTDLALSVVRSFSKNGSLVNYYMYYGGTNYGRTSAAFVLTRYYDEAPLDEFGLIREPKYGHLKDAHRAINLCRRGLFYGSPTVVKLGPKLEITTQHNRRNILRSKVASNIEWRMYNEGLRRQFEHKEDHPLELFYLTKDTTDYVWYSTSVFLSENDLPFKKGTRPIIGVASEGHSLLFVNDEFIGSGHGRKIEENFVYQKEAKLEPGKTLFIYWLTQWDFSGTYMERRYAGSRSITILGLNTGTVDISTIGWEHKVGLEGEKKQIYTEKGVQSVQWLTPTGDKNPLTWYQGYFDAPEGTNPVAIRMIGMSKGMVWINGRSIGRYWMSYLSVLKEPTQSEYHIPRTFLKPTKNLIVVFEEDGGNPKDIEIVVIDRDTICSSVTENHPPSPRLYENKNGNLQDKTNDLKPKADLKCSNEKKIVAVEFASFGDPFGSCGSYSVGIERLQIQSKLWRSCAWENRIAKFRWTRSSSAIKMVIVPI
ncbi:Beta-galactosidase 14 isoform 2 [Hibiscus syriacus]|uniref:Beta-galactosidase n=1 Tax=Hibiscus syriacus TaxID=106335 RepID=A0A6A2Y1M4_HIBSY|nr:Beta-galactosidase 14 isoform 2 [Hibiscus syriacus]